MRSLLSLIFFLPWAAASEIPSWVRQPVYEDSTYKYYIGRAVAQNEAMAVNAAIKDAQEQALKQNFGVELSATTQTYQTEKNLNLSTRSNEVSASARLVKFEQIGIHRKIEESAIQVWLLFRYPIREIQLEHERLKQADAKPSSVLDFSVQGHDSDKNKGILEVVTEPPGAFVSIGGEPFGKTPLRIIGQLETGRHQILISHPAHVDIQEDFIITGDQTIRIEKSLQKARRSLSITTTPPLASVKIDGVDYGETPALASDLEVGRNLLVEITHPETHPITYQIKLSKLSNTAREASPESLNLQLNLRPAAFSVHAHPPDAKITIDGDGFQNPTGQISLSAGLHKLKISHPDFLSHNEEIRLKGGEVLNRGMIHLTPIAQETRRLSKEALKLSFGFSTSKRTLGSERWISGFSLSAEKKMFGFFGLKFNISHLFDAESDEEKAAVKTRRSSAGSEVTYPNVSSTVLGVAIPIYLSNGFYLQAEQGIENLELKKRTATYGSSGVFQSENNQSESKSITITGLTLGLESSIPLDHHSKPFSYGVEVTHRAVSEPAFQGDSNYLLGRLFIVIHY